MSPTFLPGLELSRAFHAEVVGPIVAQALPGPAYAAARIGSGSEVLGHDTERSADHEWGPRLQLFLLDDDVDRVGEQVRTLLAERLPPTFRGWSTHFGPGDADVRTMQPADGPVRHRVEVTGLAGWCAGVLGFDPRDGVTTFDWLATPTQRLAEVTGGAVFTDGPGELTVVRERLRWYPRDLWLHLMACQWLRIAEEEAFPGRCAEVGDELGCRVVTARLVRDVVRLAFLIERRHAPYAKWLGSAFAGLASAPRLGPALHGALTAEHWPDRERHLGAAYRELAGLHDALGLGDPLDVEPRGFHQRPYLVIGGERFAAALREQVTDPEIAALPTTGGVDQFADGTALLTDVRRARAATRATLAAG